MTKEDQVLDDNIRNQNLSEKDHNTAFCVIVNERAR